MSVGKEAVNRIDVLIRARYPLLAIETFEEERVDRLLDEIARARSKTHLIWSCSIGIRPYGTHNESKKSLDKSTKDPLAALEFVMDYVEPTIFVFKDFHPFLKDAAVVRRLREVAQSLKDSLKTLILVSPRLQLPIELEKEATMLDFPLPDQQEIGELFDRILEEVGERAELDLEQARIARASIINASLGLTLDDVENILAKVLVSGKGLTENDVRAVLAEKEQIVRKSGILEMFSTTEDFGDVGGYRSLKEWLAKRRLAFSEKAKRFGLPYPRGILLLGVQGCGKSLVAKAVAGLWKLPLLRFDVGRVFSSLVGSSEENIRRAIHTAESVAPAILWVDEIDKAFGGGDSSGYTDGGTSSRVLATFLTWLQEKCSPVFVIATANSIRNLPPELMRKGRLDEIFFVDLPSPAERREIFSIHVAKRNRSVGLLDDHWQRIVERSDGFSGAEIEQAVIAALFDAFDGGGELNADLVFNALTETVPLSKTMSEEIDRLRAWAQGRARPATVPDSAEDSRVSTFGRRALELE